MRKISKRMLAFLISLIMIIGVIPVAGTAFDDGNPEIITEEIGDGNPEEGGEEEKPQYAEGTVALMYLCSNWTGFPSLGHIWAYFENVSEEPLRLGAYDLPAGEGVSVGTFGLTRSDGFGIYYNIEAYTSNVYGMDDSLYLCVELNSQKFEKISRKILNANWWDPIIVNCAFFAITKFNIGYDGFMFPWVVFPGIARVNMKRRGAQAPLTMFDPGRDRVFKQKGRGENATLVLVKDGSVDTPPG